VDELSHHPALQVVIIEKRVISARRLSNHHPALQVVIIEKE
jgi:hypothetical protein